MLRFFFIRRPAWVMWLLIILTTVCVHLITMHFNALRFDEFRLEVMQELEFYKRQLQMLRNRLKDKERDLYLIHNATNFSSIIPSEAGISLPTSFDFLPHLYLASNVLFTPALSIPAISSFLSTRLVIGIPTVSRLNISYVLPTLQSLLSEMSNEEAANTTIVLMIADEKGPSSSFAVNTIKSLKSEFPQFIKSGLLQLIMPHPEWYPSDLHSVPPTFNDSPERMYWRTKQNLDYIYLMSYCQRRGEYYMQLEDDLITKPGYITKVHKFIAERALKPWFMLEFSSLGFIGKLFRTSDLPLLIQFIMLFYREKPVDWLLDSFFINKYCSPEKSTKECNSEVAKQFRLRHRPSLFQHIGTHSSLAGKLQKLRERDFGATQHFIAHKDNPAAKISTTLKAYKTHTITNAYTGTSFFWSFAPKGDDYILIEFEKTVKLRGFLCRTGNPDHPNDILDENDAILIRKARYHEFEQVAIFNKYGTVRLELRSAVDIDAIKINIQQERSFWIIINEIQVIVE